MAVEIEIHDNPADLHSNVMRGVEYLDQLRPDWHREIDLLILNQNDWEYCVLGQLFGDAIEWGADNGWTIGQLTQHGFWAHEVDYTYGKLTDQWRAVLEQRLLG